MWEGKDNGVQAAVGSCPPSATFPFPPSGAAGHVEPGSSQDKELREDLEQRWRRGEFQIAWRRVWGGEGMGSQVR